MHFRSKRSEKSSKAIILDKDFSSLRSFETRDLKGYDMMRSYVKLLMNCDTVSAGQGEVVFSSNAPYIIARLFENLLLWIARGAIPTISASGGGQEAELFLFPFSFFLVPPVAEPVG